MRETKLASTTAPSMIRPAVMPTATNAKASTIGTNISSEGSPITTRTKVISVAITGIKKIKTIVFEGMPSEIAFCTQ